MLTRHAITELPTALIEAGYDNTPTYRRCYEAALNGAIPAKKGSNGRWTFAADDLGVIAHAFGLAGMPADARAA